MFLIEVIAATRSKKVAPQPVPVDDDMYSD